MRSFRAQDEHGTNIPPFLFYLLYLSAGNAVYAFAKGKNTFSMRHNDKSFSFTEGRYVFKDLPLRFQIEGRDLPFYFSTTKLLHTKKLLSIHKAFGTHFYARQKAQSDASLRLLCFIYIKM